jgi:hypothetical protein
VGVSYIHRLVADPDDFSGAGSDFPKRWTIRPWTQRPMDDASKGRCVPWTMLPMDVMSLQGWIIRPRHFQQNERNFPVFLGHFVPFEISVHFDKKDHRVHRVLIHRVDMFQQILLRGFQLTHVQCYRGSTVFFI